MSKTSQMSAMQRIEALLDENSFVEIGAQVTRRSTDFNMQEKSIASDGVITGYGTVDCKLVYVYSQNSKVLGGSIGEMHARKICRIYDLAMKVGAPVIALMDCAGLRLQEATDALAGFGELYYKQAEASGIIPQISAVFGKCGGGSAVSSMLSDFTIIEEEAGKLFVNSPNTLDGNYTEKCDTAAAKFQMEAGVADVSVSGEENVLAKVRELISLLPASFEDDDSFGPCNDDLNRLVPDFALEIADAKAALTDLSDDGFIFEVKEAYAKEMVTALIRLNGMTVGAVANRRELHLEDGMATEKFDGVLTSAGCKKAAEFVAFCDAFQIPVLTLTDVQGFAARVEEERELAQAAAKLTYAFAHATVPKINLITGKAYGSAYIAMNSKHIGADLVFALPDTEVGMMEAKSAAAIMYGGQDQSVVSEKAAEYAVLQASSESAAKRGYIDAIIAPEEARKHLAYAFDMLFTKKETRPVKKHGTV